MIEPSNYPTDPTSGILWAIEVNQNMDNQGGQNADCNGAVTLAEVYSSRGLAQPIGKVNAFPTPTVFNGQVYVGTQTEVNVFGICPPPPGKCEN